MKKIVTVFLTLTLLLGSLTCLLPLGTAEAAAPKAPTGNSVNAAQYTYEVIPLLKPFNTYFFVKTENPDPHSFRFVDYDSPYLDDGKPAIIDLYESYSTDSLFADVVYENPETLRVKGGYIFWCGYVDTDGGKISLQTPTYDYWGYINEWKDTGVTVTLPTLCDDIDYLIDNYCQGDSFFDRMDAIQEGLSSICLYSGNYIRGKLIRRANYWDMYRSPYVDQLFYIGSPYDREDNRRLFASQLYPLVRDSLGFPSTMAAVALRLDDKATYVWSSVSHAYVDVTYNGETRTYGGQGNGKGQGIAEENITKYFTFGNDDMGITMESLKKLHTEYARIVMEDDVPAEEVLTWKDVADTVGKNGAWVRFDSIFTYLYKANDEDYYHTSAVGSTGGSLYWGGSLGHVRSAWIDGRHIDRYDRFEQGVTFEEYPTDDVILPDVTYPVFTYKRYYLGYDQATGTYLYEYRDVTVTEQTGLLQYSYDEKENIWRISQYPTYNSDGSQTVTDYATAVLLAENGLIDQAYVDALRLTYDQVLAMGVDRNTNLEPERGYNYGGTVKAGTPFDRSAINTEELSVLFAEAKAIAEENGLPFSLDEGCYGMCGNDMYWVFLQDSQTLIITGTGDMGTLGDAPWYFDRLSIKELIVGEGVETLQTNAFYVCTQLESVTLPETLKKIERKAFYFCVDLKTVEIPKSVEIMEEDVFYDCVRMTDIYCLASKQPAGWNKNWTRGCDATVHWGIPMPRPCKHKHTQTNRKEAGCITAGYVDEVCLDCGETLSHKVLPATGHQHTKTDRKNATCTVAGYEDKICTDCGETVSHTVLPALKHNFEEGKCTRCGAERNSLGDIDGNGVINGLDYLFLKRYCLDTFSLRPEQLAAADVNGDGKVNALDYAMVKRHVLGTYKIEQ